MAVKISKANLALLKEVVEEVNPAQGYALLDADRYKALVKAGLIEVNSDIVDEDGNTAVRLTDKGNEAMDYTVSELPLESATVPVESAVEAVESPKATRATVSPEDIAISKVEIPLPEKTASERAGRSRYPFDALEVNQSFFVADADNKQPRFRNMKATVSKRNKDAEEAGSEVRFEVRNIQDGAAWGEQYAGKTGAGVWRIS